jgi:hypothetical protein
MDALIDAAADVAADTTLRRIARAGCHQLAGGGDFVRSRRNGRRRRSATPIFGG